MYNLSVDAFDVCPLYSFNHIHSRLPSVALVNHHRFVVYSSGLDWNEFSHVAQNLKMQMFFLASRTICWSSIRRLEFCLVAHHIQEILEFIKIRTGCVFFLRPNSARSAKCFWGESHMETMKIIFNIICDALNLFLKSININDKIF